MFFLFKTTSGKQHECKCCGSYSSTGKYIYINDTLVWQEYDDGHLYGETTEGERHLLIINAWSEEIKKEIEAKYTEVKRHQWNKDYPGNVIASTSYEWKKHKEKELLIHEEDVQQIIENCSHLPHSILLELKMIALWIENQTEEIIHIKTKQERNKEE